MESKSKILFAYPVAYKEDMNNVDLCIPFPFMTGFEDGSNQSIVVTVGYSISYLRRAFILVNVEKVGEEKKYENITEEGRVDTLKGAFFGNDLGVFLSSFYIHDLEIRGKGYYEIEVTLFEADSEGKKTDIVLDRHRSEFFIQTKAKEKQE